MHAVHRAVRGDGRRLAPERRPEDPEAVLLPLHVDRGGEPYFSEGRPGGQLGGKGEDRPIGKRIAMAAKSARPWWRLPSMRPKIKRSAIGTSRMERISSRFEKLVGFSKGCAEFALKKPPPFEPSCLIATWDAAGPRGIICLAPQGYRPLHKPRRLDHALGYEDEGEMMIKGRRTYRTERVMSTQKLPMVAFSFEGKALTSGLRTAIPGPPRRSSGRSGPIIWVR